MGRFLNWKELDMRHKWKIAFASVVLVGAFWIAATTHRTTQAAAPAVPPVAAEPVALFETRPIVPAETAEARRGGDALHATSRTDW